ncbi:MAG: hypothetical protein AB1640_18390 [bacterium]
MNVKQQMITADELSESITRLDGWITRNQWKGYDPFDGLNGETLRRLTFEIHLLKIAQQQLIRRFPLNLRPLLGIQKQTSSKGMGYCAVGYLKLYQATGDPAYYRKMESCLTWLRDNYCRGYAGYAWGNHFDYVSRGGRIPPNVPSIVWTSLIGYTFCQAFEAFGDKSHLDTAASACEFLLGDVARYTDADGTICFMYTPRGNSAASRRGCVHNANALAARLLARVYKHTRRAELLGPAEEAIRFTLKHQESDGSWYYGVSNKFRWVDSFHTGYVLEALHGYKEAIGDATCEHSLRSGFNFFFRKFFDADGAPRYYSTRKYPIDIQCASQGIQTLVNLRGYQPCALETASEVVRWTVRHMQDKQGYFYFRKYPFVTNRTPMFHWGQSTMLAALGTMLEVTSSGVQKE